MVCEKLAYVGKLSDFEESDRLELLSRINSLLVCQFSHAHQNPRIESEAIRIVGKILCKQNQPLNTAVISSSTGGDLARVDYQVQIRLNSLTHHNHYEVGAEWLCSQAIRVLGLLSFLKSLGWSESEIGLFELSLLGRLIHRGSERSTSNWLLESSASHQLQGQALPIHRESLRKITLKALNFKEEIEENLYDSIRINLPLESSVSDLCYYDLSNVYFEGRMQGSELSTYGPSKEKRLDQPIVTYSFLSDGGGLIKRSNFYSGNTYEASTFADIISWLNKEDIFVCDAGIATSENIELLILGGYRYLCVSKSSFKELGVDFTESSVVSFQHHCSNGYQYQVWLTSRVHKITIAGKEYQEYLLFVKSEGKQAKEDAIISKQKKRFQDQLRTIRASLSKPRGHKKIGQVHQRIGKLKAKNGKVNKAFKLTLTDDGTNITSLEWVYDDKHEERNGTYIIRTSEPITDVKKTWETYKNLTKIEALNRCCKTDLKIRPVFHQSDEGIKAHFFLTFIAANIVQYLTGKLAENKLHYSWQRILELMSQQKSTITTFANNENQWFWVNQWSEANLEMKQIYQALDFKERAHQGFFFQVENKPL